MAEEFCLKMTDFHVTVRDLLHAVNLRHGTKGFIFLPREGVLFFALKNPTASAGFEPANLGTKGQHATSRPPKPLVLYCHHTHFIGYYGLASVSSGVIMHSPPCLFPIFFKIQLLSYHFERVYFETLQLSVVSPSPRKFPMQWQYHSTAACTAFWHLVFCYFFIISLKYRLDAFRLR